jgi:hypothetical protein
MNNEDQYKKARRLVELTGVGRNYISGSSLEVPPEGPEAERQKIMIDHQIELRAKHMSPEQLNALLEFYSGEMGQSILEAQERIRLETSKFRGSLVTNTNSGSFGISTNSRSNGKGDT